MCTNVVHLFSQNVGLTRYWYNHAGKAVNFAVVPTVHIVVILRKICRLTLVRVLGPGSWAYPKEDQEMHIKHHWKKIENLIFCQALTVETRGQRVVSTIVSQVLFARFRTVEHISRKLAFYL